MQVMAVSKRKEQSRWSRIRGELLVVASGALFVALWWKVPPALYANSGSTADARLKAISDTRTALLAGLVGVGALLTFWLNSRAYRITAQALELTEQGHITERYTKAIEQLGSSKLDIRLGGLYALARVAVDSERDRLVVVEVLGAFIREHSRDSASRGGLHDQIRPRPTTDVQAALTILGRLPQRSGGEGLDLSGAQLAGAEVTGNLSGANLSRVNLSKALLIRLNLSDSNLSRADLSDASLINVNLSESNLHRVNLSGTKLSGVFGLTQSQLLLARGDAFTKLPSKLYQPAGWDTDTSATLTRR